MNLTRFGSRRSMWTVCALSGMCVMTWGLFSAGIVSAAGLPDNPCKESTTCAADAAGVCHLESAGVYTHCKAVLEGSKPWTTGSKGAVGVECGIKYQGSSSTSCESQTSKNPAGEDYRCSGASYLTSICQD
jgi:hypothetical protein